MSLRLVREGEKAAKNEALRVALDKVTRESPTQVGLHILDGHEAEVLYRVLASRQFTQAQLDVWVEHLRADHPYDRIRRGKSPSTWAIVRWVFVGGEKPWEDIPTESATDWAKRNKRWIQEHFDSINDRTWLERPLQVLGNVRSHVENETGKTQWAMPVLRWALIQLLTTPVDVATSDTHSTG